MIVMFMTPKVGNMVDRLAILLAVFLSFFLMAPSIYLPMSFVLEQMVILC